MSAIACSSTETRRWDEEEGESPTLALSALILIPPEQPPNYLQGKAAVRGSTATEQHRVC